MTNIFITLDYELFFGEISGTQERCIIKPTEKLLKLLAKYNIKATFFVDSGYLIKLKEYSKKNVRLAKDYDNLVKQLEQLSENGHDIQLHIHPHWEDSFFDGQKWVLRTHRYRLHDFNEIEINDIVYRYKKVLTDIVGDNIFAFRAGGWCVQPFSKIKNALNKQNIWLDSTVFKNGKNNSKTHFFDFSKCPDKTCWRFKDNPITEDVQGFFLELPISSFKVSPVFFWKLAYFKKFGGIKYKSFGDGKAIRGSVLDKFRMLTRFTNTVVSIDGIKSSLLQKSYEKHKKEGDVEDFVIIGHPKALTTFSLEKLEEFVIKNEPNKFTTIVKGFAK